MTDHTRTAPTPPFRATSYYIARCTGHCIVHIVGLDSRSRIGCDIPLSLANLENLIDDLSHAAESRVDSAGPLVKALIEQVRKGKTP